MKYKFLKRMLYSILIIISLIIVIGAIVMNQPQFGQNPKGERLERVKKSPNYRDNSFQNLSHTPQLSSDRSMVGVLWDFLFKKTENLTPENPLPAVKTNLKVFKSDDNVLVWLGHSSYYFQIDGKKFLADPVLVSASPLPFGGKPFKGTAIYTPEDMPEVDYLIITHDHYDHLDYNTIKVIKDRVGKIITSLGIGSHLEYWGIPADKIIEMDWHEQAQLTDDFKITALPARHFSGRTFTRNKTLWSSFMLETPSKTIYMGGDSGYDTFFKTIAEQFPKIDLAIMENGQYNTDWRYIHFLPEDLVKAVKDLKPKRLLTFHNSKFALARHPWYEPLEKISQASETENFNLATPQIGEVVNLNDETQIFEKWWNTTK